MACLPVPGVSVVAAAVLAATVCKPGTYVDANGDCSSCAPGWVSTATATLTCSRCPIPLVATEDQASCICPGSMKLSCETNTCYCPMGSYKDADAGFVCKSCPSGTTTTRIDALSCIGETGSTVAYGFQTLLCSLVVQQMQMSSASCAM